MFKQDKKKLFFMRVPGNKCEVVGGINHNDFWPGYFVATIILYSHRTIVCLKGPNRTLFSDINVRIIDTPPSPS